MKLFVSISLAVFALLGVSAAWSQQAQAPASARSQVAGIVTKVDASGSQVSFKTDKGETVTVTTNDKTQILHATAGETDIKKWGKLAVSEVAVGDQVLAYFKGPLDQKPLLATSLVIRTKADLTQLAQKELDDWKKRGTTGTVTAIDAAAKTLSIKVGQRTLTVQPSEKTEFHRYSLDSAKVSDAKPSTFADVKPGDQVNVLGNKTEDGATIHAESVFAGTFRQIAATIVSIDPATGEMKVTDLATKKPLIVRVNADSTMKKLSEQMAQGLARRYQAGGRSAGGPTSGETAPAAQRGGGGGLPGGGQAGGPRAGGDIGQMLERLPAMPLSDLKPKDAIMVSTTMGSDPTRVTAIMLLAGVEPILTAAPNAARDIMSGWNLGGGGGGEGN
jgi:hypothetical protein